jgi:hypothetical protein
MIPIPLILIAVQVRAAAYRYGRGMDELLTLRELGTGISLPTPANLRTGPGTAAEYEEIRRMRDDKHTSLSLKEQAARILLLAHGQEKQLDADNFLKIYRPSFLWDASEDLKRKLSASGVSGGDNGVPLDYVILAAPPAYRDRAKAATSLLQDDSPRKLLETTMVLYAKNWPEIAARH